MKPTLIIKHKDRKALLEQELLRLIMEYVKRPRQWQRVIRNLNLQKQRKVIFNELRALLRKQGVLK